MKLIKKKRAREMLDVSESTLRRMIHDGRLECVRLGVDGRSDRIPVESIERLVNERCLYSSEDGTGTSDSKVGAWNINAPPDAPRKRTPRGLKDGGVQPLSRAPLSPEPTETH
jgi:excisionase family DNA binding protein